MSCPLPVSIASDYLCQVFVPSTILNKNRVEPELSALGDKVLTQDIFDAVTDAERNLPYLRGNGRMPFGRPRNDSLLVTEGWTKLQNFGIQNGSAYFAMSQLVAGDSPTGLTSS